MHTDLEQENIDQVLKQKHFPIVLEKRVWDIIGYRMDVFPFTCTFFSLFHFIVFPFHSSP